MVEQTTATVSNPTFGNAVLTRTAEAGQFWLNAKAFHGIHHILVEVSTAVEDHGFQCGVLGEGFAQLLDYPFARRMSGHVEVQDALPTVQQYSMPKVSVGTVKKSTAAITSRWFRKKVSQRFAGSGLRGAFHIQRSNSPFRDFEAQHLQFTLNSRCSPCQALRDHAEDQLAQFGKEIGDLLEGKRTLMLIHLLKHCSPKDRCMQIFK